MARKETLIGLAFAALGISTAALASQANPGGIAYDSNISRVSLYDHPTGLLVAALCNSDAPQFQIARASGTEVLQYLPALEVPDGTASQLCPAERNWYQGDPRTVALWPYPSYGARVSGPGHHLADVRAGSAWANSIVVYVSQLMRANKVDGIFLDGVGARFWNVGYWNTWSKSEQDAYTQGAIDLVRRLDAARRAINPRFIIMTNNMWDRGDALGFQGEAYVDGVCIEHHPATDPWSVNYANHAFSNLGHRRVLAIGRSTEDARAWAQVPGVTHVSDQSSSQYGQPNPPLVPFHVLTDRRTTP